MSTRIQAPRRRYPVAGHPRLPLPLPASTIMGRAQPEASIPCAAPFDGDDWMFSVEWEGSRCLLVTGRDGSVQLQGETASLDERFPEIVAAAPLVGSREAIVDGTICVLDSEGRPDLGALFTRVSDGTLGRPPAVFLATDLLHLDSSSITNRPLAERLQLLAPLIPAESRIQLPDHVAGHGTALARAATARGLHALLARRMSAPYRAGMASPDRLRIPLADRRDLVVVGWFSTQAGVSVVLADWANGRLTVTATAAVTGPGPTRWLAGAIEVTPEGAPVDDAAAAGPEVTWVKPRLVATVDAPRVPAAPPGGLPQLTLVALRDDVNAQWCVRRRPVEPPAAEARIPLRAFSPTVMSALPISAED